MKNFYILPLILIALILFAGCSSSPESELAKKRLDIATQALTVAKTVNGPDSPIVVHGKVILFNWNPDQNEFIDWYGGRIPDNLRAEGTEEEITVFILSDQQYEKVGTWVDKNGNELPGYQPTSKIIAIYWPELTVAGVTQVTGIFPDEKQKLSSYNGQITVPKRIRENRGAPLQALVGWDDIDSDWFNRLKQV